MPLDEKPKPQTSLFGPKKRLFSSPVGNLFVFLLFLAAGIVSLSLGNREPLATIIYFSVSGIFLVLTIVEWMRSRKSRRPSGEP